jgi:hypothetical protein
VISELTLAELRCKHAQLSLRAEQGRARWRGMVNASSGAAAAGRRVKDLQARAGEYEMIIRSLT